MSRGRDHTAAVSEAVSGRERGCVGEGERILVHTGSPGGGHKTQEANPPRPSRRQRAGRGVRAIPNVVLPNAYRLLTSGRARPQRGGGAATSTHRRARAAPVRRRPPPLHAILLEGAGIDLAQVWCVLTGKRTPGVSFLLALHTKLGADRQRGADEGPAAKVVQTAITPPRAGVVGDDSITVQVVERDVPAQPEARIYVLERGAFRLTRRQRGPGGRELLQLKIGPRR